VAGATERLAPEHAHEYGTYSRLEEMFQLRSCGLQTARDTIAYDFNCEKLSERIEKFIRRYNTEVYRHKADSETDWPDHVDWSRDLKQDALRGRLTGFEEKKLAPRRTVGPRFLAGRSA